MKKNTILALVLVLIAHLSYAEQTSVECNTNESFVQNNCHVCYTQDFMSKESSNGWTSEIKQLDIPWKHSGGENQEMLYDDEQKKPELRTNLKYTHTPDKIDDVWTNHNDIVWQPFEDNKEVILSKNEEVKIYTLENNASITVQGERLEDTVLFFTNIRVRDFIQETNNITPPKDKNVCVLGTFNLEKKALITPIPEPTISEGPKLLEIAPEPAPILETGEVLENSLQESQNPVVNNESVPEIIKEESTTKIEIPALNSAPQKTVITKEQTKTQTGPLTWIMFALALSGAGYITNRKKLFQ